jgi:dihydrofolate reductase
MMDGYWPTAADNPNASKHDIEHSTWYNKVDKIVISRSMEGQQLNNTRIIGDNLANEISHIKQQAGRDILIFGSPSASHYLMQQDLIDEYWLFVNPIVLGAGIPLFTNIAQRAQLTLLSSKAFSSGVVCLHYERKRDQ